MYNIIPYYHYTSVLACLVVKMVHSIRVIILTFKFRDKQEGSTLTARSSLNVALQYSRSLLQCLTGLFLSQIGTYCSHIQLS